MGAFPMFAGNGETGAPSSSDDLFAELPFGSPTTSGLGATLPPGVSLFSTRSVVSDDEAHLDSDAEFEYTESSDFDDDDDDDDDDDGYNAASVRALIGSPVIAGRDISTPEGNPMDMSFSAL